MCGSSGQWLSARALSPGGTPIPGDGGHCLRHGGIRISSPGGSSLIIGPRSQNKSFVYNEARPAPANERFHSNPTVFMLGTKIRKWFRTPSRFSPSYQWAASIGLDERSCRYIHTFSRVYGLYRPKICLNLMRYLKSFVATGDKMSTVMWSQVLFSSTCF